MTQTSVSENLIGPFPTAHTCALVYPRLEEQKSNKTKWRMSRHSDQPEKMEPRRASTKETMSIYSGLHTLHTQTDGHMDPDRQIKQDVT